MQHKSLFQLAAKSAASVSGASSPRSHPSRSDHDKKTKGGATGSFPRTKLPFLQQVVKRALGLPPLQPPSPSSSHPHPQRMLSSGFAAYPLLGPQDTKQTNGSAVLYRDEVCVLVNDAFPKSTVHCLLLPLDLSLRSLNDLTYTPDGPPTPSSTGSATPPTTTTFGNGGVQETAWRWDRPKNHVELLEHMSHVADAYVQFLRRTSPQMYERRRFITGFHAIPSLPQLHLHLVSMDLESPCLKNSKHYNSFATYFFLTVDRVVEDLKRNHRITINQSVAELLRMEEGPMECLWCGTSLKNMPAVKQHVPQCRLNKSMMDQREKR